MLDIKQQDIDSHDIVSFDIFDTALFRRSGNHRTTFFLIQCQLQSSDLAYTHPDFVSNFMWLRQEAERAARRERVKEEGDDQPTFDEIYDVLIELAGVPQHIAHAAQKLEFELEANQLYRNEEIYELYQYAINNGKRVIFVSDMYHTRATLTEWLSNAGYTNPEVYVSCDVHASKHDGSIYSALGVSNVIHIGDNKASDVENAIAAGWSAYHYRGPDKYEIYVSDSDATHGLLQGPLLGETFANDYQEVGANVFGPLVMGLLLWIYHNTEEGKPIWFLARDGAVLYTLMARFFKDRTIHYVDTSRIAALQSSIYSFDIPKLTRYVSGASKRTVGEILRAYGLEQPEKYMHEVHRAKFQSLQSTVNEDSAEQLTTLLLNLQSAFQQIATEKQRHAESYFEPFLSDHISIVDLGWSASTQLYLAQVLNARRSVQIDGLYYQLWNLPDFDRTSLHNTYSAFLRDAAAPHTLSRALQSGGVEILENVLSEIGGTVLTYSEDGSVREEYSHPHAKYVEQFHIGIERYVERAMPLFLNMNYSTLIMYMWNKPFERMVLFPTAEEADLIGSLSHGDGVGGLGNQSSVIAPIVPDSLYEQELENAYWTQGFVLRNQREI